MMKEKFKKILIEVPTIVLSVIIALAINEWNNQRERETLIHNVIVSMKEELDFNTDKVQKAYDYHVPLVNNLLNGKNRMFSIPMNALAMNGVSAEQLQLKLRAMLEQFGEVVERPLIVKKRTDSVYTMVFKKQIVTIKILRDTLNVFGRGNISLRSAFIRNNAWRTAQAAQVAPYLDFKLIAMMSEIDQMHLQYESTTGRIIDMLYRGESDVTPAMQDMVYYEKKLLLKYEELRTLLN